MSTVYVVIRTIGEKTYQQCLNKVIEMGFEYDVVSFVKRLEKASKKTIQIAGKISDKYEWVMALDADIILQMNKKQIERYCKQMSNEYKDRKLFSFTGYIDCTKRGIVSGIHFFNTKYCREVFNYVKNKDFSFHLGREEYEICETAKNDLGMLVVGGYKEMPFGKHFFEAQLTEH